MQMLLVTFKLKLQKVLCAALVSLVGTVFFCASCDSQYASARHRFWLAGPWNVKKVLGASVCIIATHGACAAEFVLESCAYHDECRDFVNEKLAPVQSDLVLLRFSCV